MNNHCGWFESEYKDASVVRIMIIPTLNIAFDANFTHDVRIVRKDNLKQFTNNMVCFFKEFKDADLKNLSNSFVNKCLNMHKLSDDDIKGLYSEHPVSALK